MKKSKTTQAETDDASQDKEDGAEDDGEKVKRVFGMEVGEKAFHLASDLLVLFSGKLVQEEDDEELNNVILKKKMDTLQQTMVEFFKEALYSGMCFTYVLTLYED